MSAVNKIKKLGIFMDHSAAHLIEFHSDSIQTTEIKSEFTHLIKNDSLSRSEYTMHNKEQQQEAVFYKKLAVVIKDYNDVLLFGPTEAKIELYNILKLDKEFEKINITLKQADKMTDNQQHAFVKEYFELHKKNT